MKKVLSFLVFTVFLALIGGGIFLFNRYKANPEQIVPYPYYFLAPASALQSDAPILIIGDRMGEYFAKFKTELSSVISQNLDNSIKIQSLAQSGDGIHRTLYKLKALKGWPQILIYQGGSEEFLENKFELGEIPKIVKNFKLYEDERIETALILYPWLSRVVYEPVKRTALEEVPDLAEEVPENEYLRRLETELLLYEKQLVQLVDLSKDRNSLLILSTTPINLDIEPKRVCGFTSNLEIEKEILGLEEVLQTKNFKAAYTRSSKLVTQYSGNAKLFYLHGLSAKGLGKIDEARKAMLEASAFDCSPWRSSEVFNSIIRKVAREKQVLLFDYAKLVDKNWTNGATFFDEIYPQNLYYERGTNQLGLVIKNILKL